MCGIDLCVTSARLTSPHLRTDRKLSRDEMERRRQEMMQNAKVRDEQRETNVKRYRDDDAREEEQLSAARRQRRGKSAEFIK